MLRVVTFFVTLPGFLNNRSKDITKWSDSNMSATVRSSTPVTRFVISQYGRDDGMFVKTRAYAKPVVDVAQVRCVRSCAVIKIHMTSIGFFNQPLSGPVVGYQWQGLL